MNDQPPIGATFLIAVVIVLILGLLGASILAALLALAGLTIRRRASR